MKLIKLKLQNFQTFESVEINFEKINLCGIVGKYSNDTNKSNGTGKSTIIDGILFSLYGVGRTRLADDMIRIGEEEMSIEFEFEINGQDVKIERGRGKKNYLSLIVNEKNVSEGIIETQEKIEKLIGMNYDLFVNTVFFQQYENDGFCAATPSVRKDYLENLLDLNFYRECYKISKDNLEKSELIESKVKERLGFIKENIEKIDIEKIKKEKEKFEKELVEIKEEIKNNETILEEVKKKRQELQKRNELKKDQEELQKELIEIGLEIEENKNALIPILKSKVEDIEKREVENEDMWDGIKEITEEIELLQNEKEKIEKNELTELGIKITELQTKIIMAKADMENVKGDISECPACKQIITKEYRDKLIDNISLLITGLELEENNIKEKLKVDKLKTNKIEEKIKINKTKKEDKNEIYKNNEKKIKDLQKVKEEKIKIEEKVKNLSTNLKIQSNKMKVIIEKIQEIKIDEDDKTDERELKYKLDENKEELERLVSDLANINKEIKDYNDFKKEIVKLKEKHKELNDMTNTYNILKGIFSKNGIISEIIKLSIDEIEIESNRILSDITSDDQKIIFDTIKENKTGDVKDTLDIFIETNKGKRRYESFSGGEKTLINFSIRMALSQLLSKQQKKWFGIIVLDEVFAQLDRVNRDKMISVISYLKKIFSQIICISHDAEINDVFPNLIMVIKDNKTNISRIESIK